MFPEKATVDYFPPHLALVPAPAPAPTLAPGFTPIVPAAEEKNHHHLLPPRPPLTLMAHHHFVMPNPPSAASAITPDPLSRPLSHNQPQPHPHHPLSPIASVPTTPHNSSPTSPRPSHPHPPASAPAPPLAALQAHLRPPKSPLYIPAVLRPTDPPRRITKPLTPPQSGSSSFDDLEDAKTLTRSLTADGATGLGLVWDGPCSLKECSLEGLGRVTGAPTREHWKPDSTTPICDDPACTLRFTYFTRRHHCRRCGNIFCDAHSPFSIPLDQDANYHPRGALARACRHCFLDFRRWYTVRASRARTEEAPGPDDMRTPTLTCRGKRGAMMGLLGQGKNADGRSGEGGVPAAAAASVPRDWHWSTF